MSSKIAESIMNLKNKIEKIFRDNTSYSNPHQAVNQADSLDALSKDLYADSKRFIYELLQNADDSAIDCQSVSVWIKIIDNNLIVAHSGKSFDERDIQGICNVNNGTKKSDITKTGYKGIGFKSVFGQSQKVLIFTNNVYFKFDAHYKHDWHWEGGSQQKWEIENDRKFQYPWQIIPIYIQTNAIDTKIHEYLQSLKANVATVIELKNNEDVIIALNEISQKTNMYLFLKNVTNIFFDLEQSTNIFIDRKGNGEISLKCNSSDQSTWLSRNFNVEIPLDIKTALINDQSIPDKFKNITKIDITLCAKLKNRSIVKLNQTEKLLYSYLPTDEEKYDLPVLVNASFLTTANRESLHTDSIWNQWLFAQIGTKLFEWITELVRSEYQYQAYNLLPKKIVSDSLGEKFNQSVDMALETIAFVTAKNGGLIKVKDSIIDFTFLSDKDYVGEESIKNILNAEAKYFTTNTGFGQKLKELGAASFEWKNVPDLLSSVFFQNCHSSKKNIDLIKHFHYLSNLEKFTDLKAEEMKKMSFILDHKKTLCFPQQISFPSTEDIRWNDINSVLSFVHEDIQIWLKSKPDVKNWLENLGVTEKTDVTYIEQIIIPNIKEHITHENAIQAIQDLFHLYEKGDLKKDLIERLSSIRLLTKNGSLKPANECHLSNFYDPRFAIENILNLDIFVSDYYCIDKCNKNTWKNFFKIMGVKEYANVILYPEKILRNEFINAGYDSAYFNADDKKFKPLQNTFTSDFFSNITTIDYVHVTKDNIKFSFEFWRDFIGNNNPSKVSNYAKAFWGYDGRSGRIEGSLVCNYISWYVRNITCIPAVDGNCYSSANVFLNTQEIKDIGGHYLPIFDGVDLIPDWRAFFEFKIELKLNDYLSVLTKISQDTEDDGVVIRDNIKRVNLIYKYLLNQCLNWGADETHIVKSWGKSNQLLNTHNKFTGCNSLKYFLDGNDSIFQEQFDFISFNAENRQSSNLEKFLNNLDIQILRQSDFELITVNKSECTELKEHLKKIMPYFKIWIEYELNNDVETFRALEDLYNNINMLNINHAQELRIQYSEINFTKDTNIHFDKNEIHITSPWSSNRVLLTLSNQLCRFLGLQGYDKKLDFLLRSKIDEIHDYFVQENISFTEEVLNQYIFHNQNKICSADSYAKPSSFDSLSSKIKNKEVPTDYYHMSEADFEKLQYVESIISRSVENVIKHLKTLNGYDCTNHYEIAKSIIGGIKKYGHEITVVARPSDNSQVLLFYTSEFDVLSHVDAEFWCEDGEKPPKQIRLGQLLTQTGINRIPVKHIDFSIDDIECNLKAKSQTFDFDAIPFTPEKTARIIASFANTDGGKIAFGIKEISTGSIEIVGLSEDFDVMSIVQKSISMLSPIPSVNYEWANIDNEKIFLIEIVKQDDQNILFNDAKYIRNGIDSILEKEVDSKIILNNPIIEKTFAIIISVENYTERGENTIHPVKYANNDALAFKDILTQKMNVDEGDIYFFADSKALKSDLENGLKGVFFQLTENDRIIFYYAGHGFHNGTTNFLTTYDSYPSNLFNTSVSLRDILLDPLKNSRCKNALIFIDACAEHLQIENQRNNVFSINDEQFMLIASKFPSYSVFLSCQTGEKSYSCDSLKHGVWTYYLINALSGIAKEAHDSNHSLITDKSLRDYLSIHVSKYVNEELGYSQNPKAILESSFENVII